MGARNSAPDSDMMHRRKAFRPRAIDIDRPMAIVRHEIDNNDMRSVPELDTGMDQEEEEVCAQL